MAIKILLVIAERAIVIVNKALYLQILVHLSNQLPSHRGCILPGLATRITVVLPKVMFELEELLPSLLVTVSKRSACFVAI